jgi:hypothetical protein
VFDLSEPLPLIIFKHTVNPKILPQLAEILTGSYNCGWFMHDGKEAAIIQWGNCKNKEAARKLMADVLQKQGERPILFYDKEIPRDANKSILVTGDKYADIMATAEKWH